MTTGTKKDINEVSAKEIEETVAMIGQQKAQAIVDFRDANGPIENMEDLLRVPGFQKKLVESLEIYFEVGNSHNRGGGRKKKED